MAEAEGAGYAYSGGSRVRAHTSGVHDDFHDARAGLGVYYRWEPRDLSTLSPHHIACPKLHISVFERIANGTGRYAPINLPHHYEVVRTNDERSWPSDQTLWAIERQVPHGAHSVAGPPKNESLLEGMAGTVRSGKMSYYTFVAASIPAVGWWHALPPVPQVTDAIAQWCSYPNLIIGAIYACVGLLVWGWSKRVDGRMESAAQTFWHRRREPLRTIFTDSHIQRGIEPAHKVARVRCCLTSRTSTEDDTLSFTCSIERRA